jgi:hypothetical protein
MTNVVVCSWTSSEVVEGKQVLKHGTFEIRHENGWVSHPV